MSMSEVLNKQLVQGTVSGATFVPGNSAKDLYPLGYFMRKDVSTDPTAGGNVGNIASSNTWWRPKTAAFGAALDTGNAFSLNVTTYAGMIVALKRLYNHCSRGSGGSPDIALFNQESYEIYENSLDTKVRYTNTKLADAGFDNIKLRGATCIWDEVVPKLLGFLRATVEKKLRELLGHPTGQSAAKLCKEKVQRLFRKEVQPSGWKLAASY